MSWYCEDCGLSPRTAPSEFSTCEICGGRIVNDDDDGEGDDDG